MITYEMERIAIDNLPAADLPTANFPLRARSFIPTRENVLSELEFSQFLEPSGIDAVGELEDTQSLNLYPVVESREDISFKRFFACHDFYLQEQKEYIAIIRSDVRINYAETFDARYVFDTEEAKTFDARYVFDTEEIEQNLLNIRQETEEIYKRDNEIDRINEMAYSDIKLLLNIINKENPHILMPELDWADDGSLNTTWVHKENVITMGVYGNNVVHFNFYFEEKRQMSGVCELSDRSVLNGFLQTLANILHE